MNQFLPLIGIERDQSEAPVLKVPSPLEAELLVTLFQRLSIFCNRILQFARKTCYYAEYFM